jgi:hypothetical protein
MVSSTSPIIAAAVLRVVVEIGGQPITVKMAAGGENADGR